MENESDELKDNIGKEKTDNELLKNRNKILHEENNSITSKFDFITNNYDYTTNLKKISMEDLKNLERSNTLVNNTIGNFVEKVGTFKKRKRRKRKKRKKRKRRKRKKRKRKKR